MPLGVKTNAAPGKPDDTSAPVAQAAIERAVALVQAGEAAAVVTNPIAKSVMQAAGFAFPGHTEFLAHLAVRAGAKPPLPVMLIWSEELAVVPVTIHVPLAEVPRLLTTDLIFETGRIVAREFASRFGIARPRLAVCGLNPHAGEGGHLGREEIDVIAPAIAAMRAAGHDVTGPFPADTVFVPGIARRFDAIVAMYHDQGLPALKAASFGQGINVTLGLPFIRTSVDHGTALDLAVDATRARDADPGSLIAALDLAIELAGRADKGAASGGAPVR
jgi:4-hydroxythreonine-4-phosphate dehydrogenase